MSSTSEKGHAKNVANLSKLIEVCKGFGAKYKPAKAAITLDKLNEKLAACTTELQNTKNATQYETTARHNRANAFKDHNKLSTRLLAACKASDVSAENVKDAVSINKKIQGERITSIKTPPQGVEAGEATQPNTISTSQLSYTNIVDHYRRFKTLLDSVGSDYVPNEPELQVASLETYINTLDSLNNAVNIAEVAASNTLIKRNKIFYDEKTGIPVLAQAIKDYVKSLYGATSPQYRQVTRITITNA